MEIGNRACPSIISETGCPPTALRTVALSGGQAQLSTSTLSVGPHSITATYNGSSTYSTSTSATLAQGVNKASTATTLASSLNPSVSGQTVTFTATGTVTFYDNGTSIRNAALSGGTAKLSTSTLLSGTHPITATYNGDGNDASSNSTVVNQTVRDFGISAPSPQTVSHGSNVSFTVTITPISGFSNSVTLSVTGLPSRSSASFSPASASGPAWTSILKITTSNKTPTGTKTLTIKGTSGSLSHTTTVQLTVN